MLQGGPLAVVVDAVGGVTLSNRTVFGLATEAPIGIRQLAWPPLPSVFTGERDCPNRVDAPAARAAYVIAWGLTWAFILSGAG